MSLGIVFTILIVLWGVDTNINAHASRKLLAKAEQNFTPIAYGAVSQASIDQTLIDLEKPLEQLRGEYLDYRPDYSIRVYLFPNVQDLVSETGTMAWAGGGTLTTPGQPPELSIPVQEDNGIWDFDSLTPTPSHEITHVVTFEVLRLKSMNLVNTFFLEGMANYESLKDWRDFPGRVFNRYELISARGDTQRLKSLPTIDVDSTDTSQEDVALFYGLSEEFMRYLVQQRGERTVWRVIQDVGNGSGFYDAFKKEYGSDYYVVYSEFLNYFY